MRCTWISHHFCNIVAGQRQNIKKKKYLQFVDGPQTNIQSEANFTAVLHTGLLRSVVCFVCSCGLDLTLEAEGCDRVGMAPDTPLHQNADVPADYLSEPSAQHLRGDFGSSSGVSFSSI